jgi:hypothetical protein
LVPGLVLVVQVAQEEEEGTEEGRESLAVRVLLVGLVVHKLLVLPEELEVKLLVDSLLEVKLLAERLLEAKLRVVKPLAVRTPEPEVNPELPLHTSSPRHPHTPTVPPRLAPLEMPGPDPKLRPPKLPLPTLPTPPLLSWVPISHLSLVVMPPFLSNPPMPLPRVVCPSFPSVISLPPLNSLANLLDPLIWRHQLLPLPMPSL